MSKESKHHKETDSSTKKKSKTKPINIPLTIVPNDETTMDDEMSDLFNEDKVKHEHGHTEPERD
ncbi:MAG TPA: hypothetical protein VFH55_03775 [Nitrospiria bacterium]|nr:hypothetical protein [Nitrospiria bacterium]